MNDEIDIMDVIKVIKKNWIGILVLAIVGMICGACYTGFIQQKEYRSETSILVALSHSTTDPKEYDYNNSLLITNTVYELATQNIILSMVAADVGLSTSDIKSMISISKPTSALLLIISCTANSPELSKQVADSLADHLIGECMSNSSLAMIGDGLLKTSSAEEGICINSSPAMHMIIAMLFGVGLGVLFAFVREVMIQNRLKKRENVLETGKIVENL